MVAAEMGGFKVNVVYMQKDLDITVIIKMYWL